MTHPAASADYGTIIDNATLTMERLLPGPIARVWAHLTDGDLRRQWLASGAMEMRVGSSFELVWRNDELTDPPGHRPAGFGDEHRMAATITELDPPRRLAFTWGSTGGVTFTLEPKGDRVLLTLVHRRIAERETRLNIAAGWHAHLDILAARIGGQEPAPFWDHWGQLKRDYAQRLAA